MEVLPAGGGVVVVEGGLAEVEGGVVEGGVVDGGVVLGVEPSVEGVLCAVDEPGRKILPRGGIGSRPGGFCVLG